MDFLKQFSVNLKKIRINKKITIKEMADISGIQNNFLIKINNLTAMRVNFSYIKKIANILTQIYMNCFIISKKESFL